MGIKQLNSLLKQYCKDAIKETKLNCLNGKIIAIDTSIFLYKYMYNLDYLGGFISHSLRLLLNGITPFFIFDGKPPEEKNSILQNRKNKKIFYFKKKEFLEDMLNKKKEEIEVDIPDENDVLRKIYEEYINKTEIEITNEIKKVSKKIITIKKENIDKVKELLDLMGIPYFDANGEAETVCARLYQNNLIDGCITEDTDYLANGGNFFIKSFNKNNNNILLYDLNILLCKLEINYNEFIDLCILCGCDYCTKIFGIGPITAYKLIKKYRNIENIIENIKTTEKYKIPDDFNYKNARSLFKNYMNNINYNEVKSLIKLRSPNIEKLNLFIEENIPEKKNKYLGLVKKQLVKYHNRIFNGIPIKKKNKNKSITDYFSKNKKKKASNNDVIITENIL